MSNTTDCNDPKEDCYLLLILIGLVITMLLLSG